MLLHRSDPNISANFVKTVGVFNIRIKMLVRQQERRDVSSVGRRLKKTAGRGSKERRTHPRS